MTKVKDGFLYGIGGILAWSAATVAFYKFGGHKKLTNWIIKDMEITNF